MKRLSCDEVSLLGECLWDACAHAERQGICITFSAMLTKRTACPFGALLGTHEFPGPKTVARATGLPRDEVEAFMRGFAEPSRVRDGRDERPMALLGFRFREQAELGGFQS